ncbi:hypothetical protein HanPSC8_Chr07g0305021 [Helianthus annuus]|nr:hypothetical protein HanPSC8_Chr07g0305021 [Helianthus annuus]
MYSSLFDKGNIRFRSWEPKDDWQKEKMDFIQGVSRISTLPRTNVKESSKL